jgi:tetratricopeptide (TPR) repeat protein
MFQPGSRHWVCDRPRFARGAGPDASANFALAPWPIPVADYGPVRIPLGSTGKRWLALSLALLTAAAMSYQAGRLFLADRWNSAARPEKDWLRAAALEPGNGEYWHHLGLYRQWDFEAADPALAVRYLQRAVAVNPRSDRYWMDLASAYESQGNIAEARSAFQKAREVYPVSAEVAWNYGNFLVRQDQTAEGFQEIRQAIHADPLLLPLAISRCWRATPDVERLLNEVLPADASAYFQALDFFASTHQPEPGLVVWNRLLTLGKPLPLPRSFPFLTDLIAQDRAEDATRVWKQALAVAGLPHDDPEGGSLVWNGGFESDIANGGFDWRETASLSTSMSYDSAVFHSGQRSLRIDFGGGANPNFVDVFQYVAVSPQTTYHFRAYMRTDSISTESGMRFHIFDPNHAGAVELLTPDMTRTQPWLATGADIATGPQTHILEIQVRRLPSRLFNNKLSGSVWVDDVSLIPAAPEPGPASP